MGYPWAIPAHELAEQLDRHWRGRFRARCDGLTDADHFGGPPVDYDAFHYAGTAAQALRQLDDVYAAWLAGVKASAMPGWPGRAARPKAPSPSPHGHAGAARQPRDTAPRHRDRLLRGL